MVMPFLVRAVAFAIAIFASLPGSAREVSGVVVDATSGRPVAAAVVTAGSETLRTDDHGRFRLATQELDVAARAVGYRRSATVPVARADEPLVIRLAPFTPRALYLTNHGVGSAKLRDAALELIRATRLNALVIDLKSERGELAYRSDAPLATAIGAQRTITIPDLPALVRDLHRQGIYAIARIVVCRDDLLAAARPELAMRRRHGEVYRDGQGMRWVDPASPVVRDYDLAIAIEAARAGFDEIQLDYLRFPDTADVALPGADTERARVATVNAFLDAARERLARYNVFLAMDVFGYVCWSPGDLRIGQRLEDVLARVDYLSPMLYPSGFTFGIPGCANPVANVYAIVRRSLQQVVARAHASPRQLRPWLQAFKDYAFDRRDFGASEIRDQIRAAEEIDTNGWMLWNPRNVYSARGLEP